MALLEIHNECHHTHSLMKKTKGIQKSNDHKSHKILVELPNQSYDDNGWEVLDGYVKLECRLDISCFTDHKNRILADINKHNYTNNKYQIVFIEDNVIERVRAKR